MTDINREYGSEGPRGPIGLRDAVDRWGFDLAAWPDATLASHAREALLADRSFRAYRDEAGAMALRLRAAASALDQRIGEGGSVSRVARMVLAEVTADEAPSSSREVAPAPLPRIEPKAAETLGLAAGPAALPTGRAIPRPVERSAFRRHRWAALAAAVVIAAGLGSASRFIMVGADDTDSIEVVQLDPLIFGPSEGGF